jgi:hypothetical protein
MTEKVEGRLGWYDEYPERRRVVDDDSSTEAGIQVMEAEGWSRVLGWAWGCPYPRKSYKF